eukprot:CAMPEP_0174265036 /NCGR_PEP_ID=MMETSP0439-20130205/24940_1 /TAXON_ID=0 /ORGANISM="Stereomyxa ramosa, Strain Chinc5" /LENGTH=977 /DNA_ID=CAMNT_0015351249 /DNA_START=107 /DNA_END=3037 /DNA_ORIENTATION=-
MVILALLTKGFSVLIKTVMRKKHIEHVKKFRWFISPYILGTGTMFDKNPTVRVTTRQLWFSWPYILYHQFFMLGVSTVSVLLFIAETILIAVDQNDDVLYDGWVIGSEFVIALIFLYDYVLFWFISTNKINYLYLSLWPAVDFLTVITGFAGPFVGRYFYGFQYLHFIRIYVSVAYVLTFSNHPLVLNVRLRVATSFLALFSIMMAAAGFFWVAENDYQNPDPNSSTVEDYLDSLYFIFVTITTVGYGDISPFFRLTKIFIMVFMLVAIAFLPALIAKVGNIWLAYNREISFNKKDHVVIFSESSLVRNFVLEFYKYDPKPNMNLTPIAIMGENVAKEVSRFSTMFSLANRLSVVYGSAMRPRDLRRINLEHSKMCAIIDSRSTEDTHFSDQCVVMQALAVRNFRNNLKKHFKILVQVFNPVYATILKCAGLQYVVCLLTLRNGIIAHSCLTHGFTTLMGNLLRTNFPEKHKHPDINAYFKGMGDSILLIKNEGNNVFDGLVFSAVASFVFMDGRFENVILLGVCRPDHHHVLINPGPMYKIQAEDQFLVLGNKANIDALHKGFAKYSYQKSDFVDYQTHGKQVNLSDDSDAEQSYIKHNGEFSVEQVSNFSLKKQSNISSTPISMKSIMIKNYTERFDKGHVLVLGWLDGMREFIAPLRAKNVVRRPVLILAPYTFSFLEKWEQLSHFKDVFLMKGSPLEEDFLLDAGALVASKVIVVMPKSYLFESVSEDRSTAFADSGPINMYRLLTDLYRRKIGIDEALWPAITVSLEYPENVNYLLNASTEETKGKLKWQQQDWDELLKKHPLYMSGHVFQSGVVNSISAQSYFNPVIIDAMEQMIYSRIFLVDINLLGFDELESLPLNEDSTTVMFKDVFLSLQKSNLLAIAIYRVVPNLKFDKRKKKLFEMQDFSFSSKTKENEVGLEQYPEGAEPQVQELAEGLFSKSPFVFTRPDPNLPMRKKDKIYVIVPSELVSTQ